MKVKRGQARVGTSAGVAWVHLGADEERRAREYWASLLDEETLDELGLARFRDAIANHLFPATVTGMTRAAYLLFVPAMYLQVERQARHHEGGAWNTRTISRTQQDEIRRELVRNYGEASPGEGIIGLRSEERLTRYPSSIYWGPIRTLGILSDDSLSEAQYQSYVDRVARLSNVRDDTGEESEGEELRQFWDEDFRKHERAGSGLVRARRKGQPNSTKSLSFDLRRPHAEYLRRRYVERAGDSLMSHMLWQRDDTPFDYPWEVKKPPPPLARVVRHAKALSLFARGVALHYDYLVCQKRAAKGLRLPAVDLSALFAEWWSTGRRLTTWEFDDFNDRMRELGAELREDDERFMKAWVDALKRSASARDVLDAASLADLVANREARCKPGRARLKSDEALKSWRVEQYEGAAQLKSDFQFRYRARIACRIIADILSGLRSRA